MSEFEKSTERPLSLIDKELGTTIQRLDDVIEARIRERVGDEIYDECTSLARLDDEVEASLSEETLEEVHRFNDDILDAAIAQKAHEIVEVDDFTFDEDQERHEIDIQNSKILKERDDSEVNPNDTLFNGVSAMVSEELINSIQPYLEDRYKGLSVSSINHGQITFSTPEQPVDTFTNRFLLVTFSLEGFDIKTVAVYSYMPKDFDVRGMRVEPLDVSAQDGVIDGISMNALKQDATRAIQLALEAKQQ